MTKHSKTPTISISGNASQTRTAPTALHQQISDPLWLLFVIEDLIQACKINDFQLSATALEQASVELEEELLQSKSVTKAGKGKLVLCSSHF